MPSSNSSALSPIVAIFPKTLISSLRSLLDRAFPPSLLQPHPGLPFPRLHPQLSPSLLLTHSPIPVLHRQLDLDPSLRRRCVPAPQPPTNLVLVPTPFCSSSVRFEDVGGGRRLLREFCYVDRVYSLVGHLAGYAHSSAPLVSKGRFKTEISKLG